MKKIFYLALMTLIVSTVSMNAQVTIGSQADPHAGAVLDLQSTSKGLLLPHVALKGETVWGLDGAAVEGMLVYNTGDVLPKGLHVWSAERWALLQETAPTVLVTGVTLNKATARIVVGDTERLIATVFPSDATNQAVTWSSSDEAIASVSATGVVTAKVVDATATITVTTADGGMTATCTVTGSLHEDQTIYEKIGDNMYKTFTYHDEVHNLTWMVQDSREGNPIATCYNSNKNRVNGFYYTSDNAASACPSGWRLPTRDDICILDNWFKNTFGQEGITWWWGENEYSLDALSGYCQDGKEWVGWQSYSLWWSTGDQIFQPSVGCTTLSLFPGNDGWYPVRCVKEYDEY